MFLDLGYSITSSQSPTDCVHLHTVSLQLLKQLRAPFSKPILIIHRYIYPEKNLISTCHNLIKVRFMSNYSGQSQTHYFWRALRIYIGNHRSASTDSNVRHGTWQVHSAPQSDKHVDTRLLLYKNKYFWIRFAQTHTDRPGWVVSSTALYSEVLGSNFGAETSYTESDFF